MTASPVPLVPPGPRVSGGAGGELALPTTGDNSARVIHRYDYRRELPRGSQKSKPWITRIAPNHGRDQGNVSGPPVREANTWMLL